ncbi:MAG TPA: glucose-6-phosphate isomerase [Candidatus Polarisedimenticolia bacterium]|nr:glucose-6-phosphate isomerase [Candidatus Polarisedimenticolia bacterium]
MSPLTKLGALERAVRSRLSRLQYDRFLERIWKKDSTLWKSDPAHAAVIRNRLGWLPVVEAMGGEIPRAQRLGETLRGEGVRDVVVLGMGGSSLCPEVLSRVFPPPPGAARLRVLDSTDPASILDLERDLDPGKSFFVVSSKSGTTIETECFQRRFDAYLRSAGIDGAGRHFAAITDPGTPLEKLGRSAGYREVFLNPADIGGRYSALSLFGLAPAALAGLDAEGILDRAREMLKLSAADSPPERCPGMILGAILGEAALAGRDKLTILGPPPLDSFAIWAEQLVAESTGKEGKGLIPVAGEPPGDPESYGEDRLFVVLEPERVAEDWGRRIRALEEAGHPVVRIPVAAPCDLGAEFLRWELATAVAGSILGVDPFDEPNVQESKDNTRALLEEFVKTGSFQEEEPLGGDEVATFYGEKGGGSPRAILRSFLEALRPGDYFALQAYLPTREALERPLGRLRDAVRQTRKTATTLGYGPRYLHSTGQLHKGGPPRGVFLQIVAEGGEEAAIPGKPFGFSILEQAQALGDFRALRRHGRPALRVRLREVEAGLASLAEQVEKAL